MRWKKLNPDRNFSKDSLENYRLKTHSLSYSPADLNAIAKAHNSSRDEELVRGLLKRLDNKILAEKQRLDKVGVAIGSELTYISVVAEGHEQQKHAKMAVDKLKKEGYNARYEFDEACDDGPNRSSPDYHRVVLIVG